MHDLTTFRSARASLAWLPAVLLISWLPRHVLTSRQEAFIGYSEKHSKDSALYCRRPISWAPSQQVPCYTNLNLSAGDQVVLTSLHGEVILDNPKLLSTAIA